MPSCENCNWEKKGGICLQGHVRRIKYEDLRAIGHVDIENCHAWVENPKGKCCDVCGGTLTEIRGRYPHTPHRLVCPTCLQEKLERIHEETLPNYGKAYQNKQKEI